MAWGAAAEEGKPQEAAKEAHTYVFTCDDSYEFVARTKSGTAWLFLPSGTVELWKESSDEYRAEEVVFRINGQSSLLEGPEAKHQGCRNNQPLAIWEHAKLNGAGFRAIGNEPGWHLEIRNQAKIVLVTGYGSERHEFELPEPETDAASRATTYKACLDDQEMTLTISAKTCLDSMSGEKFECKVEVVFNGKTLHGCGRALH